MINPTGGKIRSDAGGDGHYLASRKALSGPYQHRGSDLECQVGQVVKAPISGDFVRVALPYGKDSIYRGVEIHGPEGKIKMFYLMPNMDLLEKHVDEGHPIGIAQDIGKKWPKCGPHIHLQIIEYNPELLIFET